MARVDVLTASKSEVGLEGRERVRVASWIGLGK